MKLSVRPTPSVQASAAEQDQLVRFIFSTHFPIQSGQVLGEPDSDAYQTSNLVYHTCLQVCWTVAVSISSRDDCSEPSDNTSFKKLLVCQPQFFEDGDLFGTNVALIWYDVENDDDASLNLPGIWTDTGHCMMLICGLKEMAFLESVKSKVQKIKGKWTVNDETLQRLLDCRICPDEHNFAEIYGMYSFASQLLMFDPPSWNPQVCRGYNACYPCGSKNIEKWPGITCDNRNVVSIKISGKKKYGTCNMWHLSYCSCSGVRRTHTTVVWILFLFPPRIVLWQDSFTK